jgi:PadR family transcriptional regulator, regulatory protein PadR
MQGKVEGGLQLMPDLSQILKGLLEGCILSIVEKEESYGYEIIKRLAVGGFPQVGEGSVYPILLRLEQKKLISFVKKASPLGPDRKYYRLTEEGEAMLIEFRNQWASVRKAVDGIVEEDHSNA